MQRWGGACGWVHQEFDDLSWLYHPREQHMHISVISSVPLLSQASLSAVDVIQTSGRAEVILSTCVAEFCISINRCWAFMRPWLQVQWLSVCMCMGPTREPVRRLKRTPRKGKERRDNNNHDAVKSGYTCAFPPMSSHYQHTQSLSQLWEQERPQAGLFIWVRAVYRCWL